MMLVDLHDQVCGYSIKTVHDFLKKHFGYAREVNTVTKFRTDCSLMSITRSPSPAIILTGMFRFFVLITKKGSRQVS